MTPELEPRQEVKSFSLAEALRYVAAGAAFLVCLKLYDAHETLASLTAFGPTEGVFVAFAFGAIAFPVFRGVFGDRVSDLQDWDAHVWRFIRNRRLWRTLLPARRAADNYRTHLKYRYRLSSEQTRRIWFAIREDLFAKHHRAAEATIANVHLGYMVAVIAVGFGMAAVMSDGLNADWIPMVHPYRFLDWLRLLPVDWFWILFAGRSVIFDKALAFFGVGWIVFYGTFRFHRRFERDEFDRLLRANPRDLDRLVAPLRSALAKLEAQPPLRWVLFDVGNVLITVKHRIVSEQLLKTCPDPHQTRVVQQAIDTFIFDPGEATAPNAQLDRGVKQLEWLRHDLCQRFPVKVSEAAFTEIWLSVFAKSSNADVLDCLTRLWLQGFQIALCSNTNREHWSFITDHFPDIRHLSQQVPCFLSYQMGMIKTDPGFFEAVAKSTQSDYSNHVLVDDDQRNCRSAQQAGMQVIRFSDGKISSLANEVNRLLTQVDNRTPTGNHVRSTLQERTP